MKKYRRRGAYAKDKIHSTGLRIDLSLREECEKAAASRDITFSQYCREALQRNLALTTMTEKELNEMSKVSKMHEVAIVEFEAIGDTYNFETLIGNSITDWATVSDDELETLRRYTRELNTRYVLIVRQDVKKLAAQAMYIHQQKAREMEARRRERVAKEKARREKREFITLEEKKKLLAQLKSELEGN